MTRRGGCDASDGLGYVIPDISTARMSLPAEVLRPVRKHLHVTGHDISPSTSGNARPTAENEIFHVVYV